MGETGKFFACKIVIEPGVFFKMIVMTIPTLEDLF